MQQQLIAELSKEFKDKVITVHTNGPTLTVNVGDAVTSIYYYTELTINEIVQSVKSNILNEQKNSGTILLNE